MKNILAEQSSARDQLLAGHPDKRRVYLSECGDYICRSVPWQNIPHWIKGHPDLRG